MKNFTTTARALALSLLCALPAAMAAKHYDDHEYRDADECCGTPLFCGGFNIEVHGGIAPTLWNKRDCFLLANCLSGTSTANVSQLTALGGLPKFRDLYKLPWDVGFSLGYAICDNVEAFIEFDYRQARAKNCCGDIDDCCPTTTVASTVGVLSLCYTTSVAAAGTTNFVFSNLGKYKSFSGHVGARWYTCRYWCDTVAFFLGLKVGFVHHKAIDISISQNVVSPVGTVTTAGTPFPFTCSPLFARNTTISAGGLVGLDWCFWNRVSFVFQAEFLGQGPLRSNHNLGSSDCDNDCDNDCSSDCSSSCGNVATCVNLSTLAPRTAGVVGPNFNTEIVFPITFGLKYYF